MPEVFPRPSQLSFSPAGLLREAAAVILAEHSARLPDLRGVVVVLPHRYAVKPFAGALHDVAGKGTVLLPQITTLRDWTGSLTSASVPMPTAVRVTELYAALRERNWFHERELWGVACELAVLIDELTRHCVSLPTDFADFVRQLETAYRTRSRALNFEARVVHELWRAMATDRDGRSDVETHYQLQLARIAREACKPLYVLPLPQLSSSETAFLDEYAKRMPVTLFNVAAGDDPCAALLDAAWPQGEARIPSLRDRALNFTACSASSPVAERLRLFGAMSLEQEAQAIEVTIREWILAGHRRICVVVQDFLVARRARALLERAGVLVEDEQGWAFSTTSASTVLGRWLDVVAADYYHQDLLDLLKSPFLLSDWEPERRRRAVFELELSVRSKSAIGNLARYEMLLPDIAARDANAAADAAEILGRLKQADRTLGRAGRRTISEWIASLVRGLESLGITTGLARDSAGTELMELVARRGVELEEVRVRFSFPEWRAWLNRELESETYRDPGIESPVVFTGLAQSRLRDFDAVIIAGADAAHLPSQSSAGPFFNESVRAALGLPTAEDHIAIARADLILLLSTVPVALVSWQSERNAEPNLPSPFIARLQTFHEVAYSSDLFDTSLSERITAAQIRIEEESVPVARQTVRPAPLAEPALVPERVSASAYASLVACPYQFYARHMLRLNELDEVSEELEKRDFGLLVHKILRRFHEARGSLAGVDRSQLELELRALSEEVFKGPIETNYLSRGWLSNWLALIPHYLDWHLGREGSGWRWQSGEQFREKTIQLADGGKLALYGRLDRIDAGADGRLAVLDYKMQRRETLRERLKEPGEDVQLPCYLLLLDRAGAEASYVGFDRHGIRELAVEDPDALAAAMMTRLCDIFSAMNECAPLPAHGADRICDWCEMSGLCRKQFWESK